MHLSWLDPHKMRKMTVVGREKMVVFDDMEPERKVTVYEKSAGPRGRARTPATSRIPKIATDEPLRLECAYFLRAGRPAKHDRDKVARDGARVVRALEMLTNSLDMAEIHPTAIVYEGTVLGDGVRVLENAVVGKQPSLGAPLDGEARAAAADGDRRRHRRLDRRDRVRRLDASARECIVGDQSCIRERVSSATTASSGAAR